MTSKPYTPTRVLAINDPRVFAAAMRRQDKAEELIRAQKAFDEAKADEKRIRAEVR